jgi:hypothetical protein
MLSIHINWIVDSLGNNNINILRVLPSLFSRSEFKRRGGSFTSVCDLCCFAFALFVINVYDLPRVTE